MTTPAFTIRKRIAEARAFLGELDCAVLTTFSFNADFFEENVLPVLLVTDDAKGPARRMMVHDSLGVTAVSVFFDPAVAKKPTGRYRYSACPVWLKGRLFHTKNIILAGRDAQGTVWVYVSVSSANLTLSGWGRNVECLADTWIHTQKQQAWAELSEFTRWLAEASGVNMVGRKGDALVRLQAALEAMPDQRRFSEDDDQPWSGKLRGNLYFSPLHPEGFPEFLRKERGYVAPRLVVYSPYWGDVTENVGGFLASEVELVPALLPRPKPAIGIGKEHRTELEQKGWLRRNPADNTLRFWHSKIYAMEMRARWRIGVGSCNFTTAGLSGANGNVESMLVYSMEDPEELLPGRRPLRDAAFAEMDEPEEGAPTPAPIGVVVFFDWQEATYRWWLRNDAEISDVRLDLPARQNVEISAGWGELKTAKPPRRGATFTVRFVRGGEQQTYHGAITEVNLDQSTHIYGMPLTIEMILDSWKGKRVPLGTGVPFDEDTEDAFREAGWGAEPQTAENTFDVLSLYEMYRAFWDLSTRLAEHQQLGGPEANRALQAQLGLRPDSVFALADRLHKYEAAPTTLRFLLLREAYALLRKFRTEPPMQQRNVVKDWLNEARDRLKEELGTDLSAQGITADPAKILQWFEKRLMHAWVVER